MSLKNLILPFLTLTFISVFGQGDVIRIEDGDPRIRIEMEPQSFYERLTSSKSPTITLPFSKVGYEEFYIKEDQMLSADFAKVRPDIKSYVIQSTCDASINGRLLSTPSDTWGTILTPEGLTSFYPENGVYYLEQGIHIDVNQGAICSHFKEEGFESEYLKSIAHLGNQRINFMNAGIKRNFKLAVVCTGDFYMLNGNNDNDVLNLIAASVSGLNVIYENELSVHLDLLQPFLYTDSITDPFIPDDTGGGDPRTDQAAAAVNANFNVDDYDIGHVFHKTIADDGWSSGGVARLGSVCNSTIQTGGAIKAKGWSGSFNNNNNGWISLAAHEFAHMFSATHTFNGEGESCDDAISETSAFEIGSGTTIMSYQGICDPAQNINGGGVSDNYFHVHSLFQMIGFLNVSGGCADQVPVNNAAPLVNPNPCGASYTIPLNTPFMLTGSATDSDGDALTYTWEEYDEDGADSPTQGFIGSQASNSTLAPLMRSFAPSISPTRYFPQLSTLIDGADSDVFQALPNVARTLKFQLTARDNNPEGGGVSSSAINVMVDDNSGPLEVMELTSVTAGTPFDLNWNTNGTESICSVGKILLSLNGGQTYPITIASDVDFSAGTFEVVLPSSFPNTESARFMLACGDFECFSFFDISNNDFEIVSTCLAGASIVCDTEFETFVQGDPSLNLGLTQFDGVPISSMSQIIFATSPPAQIGLISEDGTGCTSVVNYFTEKRRIVVDASGLYTFNIDVNAGGGRGLLAIYTAANYNGANSCPSFISSNAEHAGGSTFVIQSSMTAELEACTEYFLVFSNNTVPNNLPKTTVISSMSGPGLIVETGLAADPNYSETFIAVNDAGIIETVSPTSDFTALSGGLYDIYGVTYKSSGPEPPANADPSTWIGTSLMSVQTDNCILLSNNKKQILIEFNCRINEITTGMQSDCDPNSNTYSQEIIVIYEMPPLGGNLRVNGVPFPITGSPQTITLVGLISDGSPKGVSASFSEIPGCSKFVPDLFTAPDNCCPIDFDLGGDRVVCDSEQVILDAGSDGIEYRWFKDGVELLEMGSTLEVLTSGNYLVEVINGTNCSKFDVVNISINPTPTAELEDDLSVCEGDIYILQSNTNAPIIKWYKDGVELMNETDPSIIVTESGTYVIEGNNSFNCMVSDTVVVTYVTRPIVDLGDDQEFCVGDPAYTIDAGTDGTIYKWYLNGILIPQESGTTIDVTQTGQYSVLVDKGGGCDEKDTVNIEYFALPEVFAGMDENLCEGSSTTLFSFINADSYQWFYNGALNGDQSESPEVTEAGEYVLVGTNSIGCEVSDTAQVFLVIPPEVDLGEDKIGCIGSPVTLTVDSIGNVFWLKDGIFISSNATIVVEEAGAYVANVIAAADCTGRDTINVTFEPGPTVELGDDERFCQGEDFTITAQTNADNITWFLDEVEIVGENGFDLLVTEAGSYTAIVSGVSGCESQDQILITVDEVPSLVLGEDEVICEGELALLKTELAADSYLWTLNGSEVSNQSEVEVSTAGIYTLIVTNSFGCTDSDEIEVVVNALPNLSVDIAYSICEGEVVTIETSGNGDTFQWFLDEVEISGETSSSLDFSTSGMIEIIAGNVAGCTTSVQTQIFAAPSPTLELGDAIDLCPNQTFNLSGGDHEQYLWSSGETSSSINIISINPEMASSETYSLTVTNAEGCTAEDQILVTIFPVINGDIQTSATGVCNGEPVELLAMGGTSYLWVDPNGTLSEIEGPMALASPTETTTYQVIIGDDCPTNEDVVEVTIEVFEQGMDIDAGPDDCAINGQSYELNATGGASYSWRSDPSILSGASTANPTVQPTEETVYVVDITDGNGCVFTDSVTICLLEDPLENFKLVTIITPNDDGDNDELYFNGLEAFPENVLRIYNRWGYPVFEKSRYQQDGELWNGENGGDILPADTYYYILTFDGTTYKSTITILR